MLFGPGMSCFKGDRQGEPARPAAPADTRDADRGPSARLVCARCKLPITSDSARIQVGGSHEHTCANPHGYTFHIGCFAAAPGCAGAGPEQRAFSWFPGYSWQIAVCRACHAHLGWRFRAAASRFHGLILDRLVSERDPRA